MSGLHSSIATTIHRPHGTLPGEVLGGAQHVPCNLPEAGGERCCTSISKLKVDDMLAVICMFAGSRALEGGQALVASGRQQAASGGYGSRRRRRRRLKFRRLHGRCQALPGLACGLLLGAEGCRRCTWAEGRGETGWKARAAGLQPRLGRDQRAGGTLAQPVDA